MDILSPVIDLSRVLTPEALGPLLSNPEFREKLIPFLPSGGELPQLPSDVSSTLWSPQFHQVCLDVNFSHP
jgi:hypothetical protein